MSDQTYASPALIRVLVAAGDVWGPRWTAEVAGRLAAIRDPTPLKNRAHQWPGMPADGDSECISWRCKRCGEWVD